MSAFLTVLVALVAILMVWRFVSSQFQSGQPTDPVDDPLAPVPAPETSPRRLDLVR